MSDEEYQNDEVLVLESILDPKSIRVNTEHRPISGSILIHPEVPENFVVSAKRNDSDAIDEEAIGHLPPFDLQFLLPADYPSHSAPQFALVCRWLSRAEISRICRKLDEIWASVQGSVIIYEWIQFLQHEALKFLQIQDKLDLSWFYLRQRLLTKARESSITSPLAQRNGNLDKRAVQDVSPHDDLFKILLEYNEKQKQVLFNCNYHTCKVCFVDKLGTECLCFPGCDHCYCKECMKGFFEVQIKDGNVSGLICPEDKCTSQALPSQVKELVTPESFSRYDALLLASNLASSNLVYCPRPKCQYPVLLEPDSTMGSCPNCSFHFCIMCKATYHGVAHCKFSSGERLKMYQTYMEGDYTVKEELERRYGKKQMQSIVDDVQTESWMTSNSKPCPHCNVRIEKMDGCNKMACWRCNTYFCWLCMSKLDKNKPYMHFNDSTSKCNGLLFEGLANDDDDGGWVDMGEAFDLL